MEAWPEETHITSAAGFFGMQQRLDAQDEVLRHDADAPNLERTNSEIAHLPGGTTQLIGERIRAMYAQMVQQPIPEPLLELVRQLERKEPPR